MFPIKRKLNFQTSAFRNGYSGLLGVHSGRYAVGGVPLGVAVVKSGPQGIESVPHLGQDKNQGAVPSPVRNVQAENPIKFPTKINNSWVDARVFY